jgi:hypothetical protein
MTDEVGICKLVKARKKGRITHQQTYRQKKGFNE